MAARVASWGWCCSRHLLMTHDTNSTVGMHWYFPRLITTRKKLYTLPEICPRQELARLTRPTSNNPMPEVREKWRRKLGQYWVFPPLRSPVNQKKMLKNYYVYHNMRRLFWPLLPPVKSGKDSDLALLRRAWKIGATRRMCFLGVDPTIVTY